MDETILKVLTLNSWGLHQPRPIGSKHRKYRFGKIGHALSGESYDIVALQEVWSEKDYVKLQEELRLALPYSHYFYSGVIGSGVCVFSRYPIVGTLMHRYSLNGFAHHIHRGDWFGGKVVGMAQIRVVKGGQEITVKAYTTHIHAEYNSRADLYLAHRVIQAFELGQFVKHTSSKADLILVMGDFNVEPDGLSYRIILADSGGLKDVWTNKPSNPSDENGNTCDRPDNVYAAKSSLRESPLGKRIDYIMYHSDSDAIVRLVHAENRLNKIPGEDHRNYSDHIAVYAEFSVRPPPHSSRYNNRSRSVTLAVTSLLEPSARSESNVRKSDVPRLPPVGQSGSGTAQSSSSVETARLPVVSYRGRYGSIEAMRPLLGKAIQIVEDAEARASFDVKLYAAFIVVLVLLFILTVNLELAFPGYSVLTILVRSFLMLLIAFCVWYGLIGLKLEQKALKAARVGMRVILRSELPFPDESNRNIL